MTQPFEPTGPSSRSPASPPPAVAPVGPGRRLRAVAVAAAAVLLVGAGVGVGMAATAGGTTTPGDGAPSSGADAMGGDMHADGTKAKNGKGKHGAGAAKVDPARQTWAHTYGIDRSTMPNLAPAATASVAQQAAATDLLVRTEAATTQYADPANALAAGYDLQASLARKQQKSPRVAEQMSRIDAGAAVDAAHMPMVHVGNKASRSDGKVLDPNAPETLMYGYQGHGTWMLMGVMYTAGESYPQAPPDPGGPISRWHYHEKSGARGLMMHVFFVPGNDLAHAYAAEMS